jgi:hypothetical protein
MGDITPEFIAAVSQHTGVPAEFLNGSTAAEVWNAAERLTRWKAGSAAPPPTAAVPASIPNEPITVAGCVPDGNYLAAWRSGTLAPSAIPAPPPRRTGERHRNAAP